MCRCKCDGSVYPLSLIMISLTCFVVQPCLLDNNWLFILYTISCGISVVVYHFLICLLILLYLLRCTSLTSHKPMFCFYEDLLLLVLQEYVCHILRLTQAIFFPLHLHQILFYILVQILL